MDPLRRGHIPKTVKQIMEINRSKELCEQITDFKDVIFQFSFKDLKLALRNDCDNLERDTV